MWFPEYASIGNHEHLNMVIIMVRNDDRYSRKRSSNIVDLLVVLRDFLIECYETTFAIQV